MFSDQFKDYKWIKVKKHQSNKEDSLENQLAEFEKHHIEETSFLIAKVRELAAKIDELELKDA